MLCCLSVSNLLPILSSRLFRAFPRYLAWIKCQPKKTNFCLIIFCRFSEILLWSKKAFLGGKTFREFSHQKVLRTQKEVKNTSRGLKKYFCTYFYYSENFGSCKNFYASGQIRLQFLGDADLHPTQNMVGQF